MRQSLARTIWILRDALGHFNRDDGWAIGSHLALNILMALFPFLLFVAGLAGLLGTDDLAARAANLLFEVWPPEIAKPIAAQVTSLLTQPRSDLLTFGAIMSAILASNGVEATRVGLNRAYRQPETRSFLYRRAQSLVFVLVGAVALLTIAFALVLAPIGWSLLMNYLPAFAPFEATFLMWRYALAVLVLAVALMAAHVFLPNRKVALHQCLPGIGLTLSFWILGASAYSIYLQNLNLYAATYAGLAGLMIAIIFLYIIALILILGAEINASIIRLQGNRK